MPPTKAQLAKIHIAKKEQLLSDESYRDILAVNFKVDSAKDLSVRQAEQLLDFFRAKGWTMKPSKKHQGKKYPQSYQRKVQALWITLGRSGAIRNCNDIALNAWVTKMSKRSDLRFCSYEDCAVMIEALKAWGKREGVDVQ
jgi:phage gp16-like protein